MTNFRSAAAALTTAVLLTACNGNAPTAPSATLGLVGPSGTQAVFAGTLEPGDRQLVSDLARIYQFAADLGNFAQSLGDHDAVKSYGLQMASEYAARQSELREVAGFQFPGTIQFSPVQTTWRSRVTAERGSALDRVYIAVMIDAHQAAITELQSRVGSVNSSILRAHVADALERVRLHLKLARDTQSVL